ncbi:hypothetical protein NDU88_000892 [Pleurodeles waltl]|uniref:Uncharacterized protein n=1 Tax=Pleurodeles waltl TaxID=8319 RepID=A0AAV7U8V9_PLEWA|nr:hypothetical protein NDU88_000892 [Pleurodeles waltl]
MRAGGGCEEPSEPHKLQRRYPLLSGNKTVLHVTSTAALQVWIDIAARELGDEVICRGSHYVGEVGSRD